MQPSPPTETFPFLSRNERRFVASCSVGMLLLLLLLLSTGIWQQKDLFSNKAIIGEITSQDHDTRHRNQDALIWSAAEKNQNIRLGDAIFAGENSQAQIHLSKGGDVALGANSLIVFNEIDHEKVADFMDGNFRLSVDGEMKVSIQGQMTTIHGEGAEIQVYVDKNHRPKFKIIKGQAQVQIANRKLRLDAWNLAGTQDENIPLAPIIAANSSDLAHADPVVEQGFTYTWHLYDLYEQKDFQLFDKADPTVVINHNLSLHWSPYTNQKTKIQFGHDPEFKFPSFFEVQGNNQKELHSVYAGDNYWKVSVDEGRSWSNTEKFTIATGFLKNAEPQVSQLKKDISLVGVEAVTNVDLSSSVPAAGYVAQASLSEKFDSEVTRTFWSAPSRLRLSFFHTGTYYYRFRTVSKAQELSQWSQPIQFNVTLPPAPQPIQLHFSHHTLPKRKMPVPVVEEKRSIAQAESTSTTRYEPEQIQTEINEKYKNTVLSLQGFLWTLQSSQQVYSNEQASVASGIGLHGLRWWDHSGLEASLKSGVMAVNKTSQPADLKDGEVRYHYRFLTGFPFSLARELQISLFTGYEVYHNSGSLYANQYDLLKFGTSLEFPIASRWSSGGELEYGQSTDNSTKQEISGHLNYFMGPDWSVGVGYRLHFFQAGSASAAPGGYLPYREGYTEGYSILDYHF